MSQNRVNTSQFLFHIHWLMISWHIHLSFKGERGPQGSRGRPGEDGLKGAKVREGIVLWVDSDREMTQRLPKSSASVQRPPTLELRLCVLDMLPKLPESVSVIINTFSRKIVLQKMCPVHTVWLLRVGYSEGDAHWCFLLPSLFKGDQGLPGPRGPPGEPGALGANVCVYHTS